MQLVPGRAMLLMYGILGDGVGAFRHQRTAGAADHAAHDRADRTADRSPDADAGQSAGGGALCFVAAASSGKHTQGYDADDPETHGCALWLVCRCFLNIGFFAGVPPTRAGSDMHLTASGGALWCAFASRDIGPWPSPIPS